jgi:hypothetical protein
MLRAITDTAHSVGQSVVTVAPHRLAENPCLIHISTAAWAASSVRKEIRIASPW